MRALFAEGAFRRSLAVHALLAVAIGLSWWWARQAPSPPVTLAIEATVADARQLDAAAGTPPTAPRTPPSPEPAAVPVVREPEPALQPNAKPEPKSEPEPEPKAKPKPKPKPEPQPRPQSRPEAARTAASAAADERAAKAASANAASTAAAKAAADNAMAVKAATEKAVAAKAAADRLVAEARARAEDERLRAEREGELQRRLAQEQRAMDARASGLATQWAAAIQARIQRAWIRPPSARPGLDCTVAVTQVPGGEVVSVRVLSCNGDATTRQSIEDAVYRASPLPQPPDSALFERNLELRFRPND